MQAPLPGKAIAQVGGKGHISLMTNAIEMLPLARVYSIVLEPAEEGGFNVSVPALPEVATCGDTYAEALGNVREAIELAISYRRDRGETIPDDVAPKVEQVTVAA